MLLSPGVQPGVLYGGLTVQMNTTENCTLSDFDEESRSERSAIRKQGLRAFRSLDDSEDVR